MDIIDVTEKNLRVPVVTCILEATLLDLVRLSIIIGPCIIYYYTGVVD